MDKNSQNIVQNILFCVPHKKISNSGMEQHAIESNMTIFSFIGELVKNVARILHHFGCQIKILLFE